MFLFLFFFVDGWLKMMNDYKVIIGYIMAVKRGEG